jgi:hypothetical protein
MSAVLAIMLGLSGFLFSAFGEMGYLAMALAAMMGGGCVLAARPPRRNQN